MECLGCTPLIAVRGAATALGVSRRELVRLVETGVLVRLNRWLLVGGCVMERAAEQPRLAHDLKLAVVQTRYLDAAASHESGALAAGLPVLHVPSYAIVTRTAGAWRGGDEARVRIAPLPAHHLAVVDGRLVTVMARSVIDIARTSSLAAAAVVGDAALRRGLRPQDLRAMLDECAAWSEVGKARRSVAFLDARAESAFESLSRATMHDAEVPPPELQVELRGASGRRYRADFYWRHRRLIGEADGKQKYLADPDRPIDEVVYDEKRREDDLREAGEDFVRWNYGDMAYRSAATIARILRKLS